MTNRTRVGQILTSVVLLLMWHVASAEPAPAPRIAFHIEQQPLQEALTAFANQAGLQLLLDVKEVGSVGAATPKLVGTYTREAALEKLLASTGLMYKFVNAHTVVIRPQSISGAATIGETADGSVGLRIVKAAGQDSAGVDRDKNAEATAEVAPDAAASSQEGDGDKLQEVIVTARRREESVQVVPIAVTTFSQDDLQRNRIYSVLDLVNLVPSLSLGSSGSGRIANYVSLRGQGVQGSSGNPGVITYYNEVPMPVDAYGQTITGPATYFDLEDLQVLKGPQGTLFGRNSVGGAILFRTKRPTDEFEGHFQLGYGNYNDRQLDGVLNVPLVEDKLLVRFAVIGEQRDGYTRILATPGHPNGQPADDLKYISGRATLTYRPNERFQNDLIVSSYDTDERGPSSVLTGYNPANPLIAFFPGYADLLAEQQALGTRKQLPLSVALVSNDQLRALSNITQFDLGRSLTLRNIFGYMRYERLQTADGDATTYQFLDLTGIPSHSKQYTEELQLQGKSFADRLIWTTGLFYCDSPAYEPFDFITGSVGGGSRNAFKSRAVYGQATYDLSQWISGLKFTGGLRYTRDEKLAESVASPTATEISKLASESDAVTWTASFDYAVSARTLVYAATRRGYRPGGANALIGGLPSNAPPFGPEYVTDQELGLKSDWELAGVPVRTNVAVYHQDYTDVQTGQIVTIVDNTVTPPRARLGQITSNAAAASVWGAEAEVTVQATQRLRLGAMFGWVDFDYTDFAPGVNAAALVEQERVSRPPLNYSLNAQFRLPMPENLGVVSLSSTWSWKAENFSGPKSMGPGVEVPAYRLLSFSGDWRGIAGKPLDVSFFMTNVLNNTYKYQTLGLYNALGYATSAYAEPRLYGLRLRYNF